MAVETTLAKARPHVIRAIKHGIVPMIKGKPGVGKTFMIKSIAAEFNLKLITKILSQADPTDLNGMVDVSGEKGVFKPFEDLPVAGDWLPIKEEFEQNLQVLDAYEELKARFGFKGQEPKEKADELVAFQEEYCYSGFMLFLDEFGDAAKMVQNAANNVMLEKRIGQKDMHPMAVVVGAMNRIEDKAGVSGRMSTATQTRIMHITISENLEEFLNDFAYPTGFREEITSFLNHQPQYLHHFDPNHTQDTFACNRTWEMVNTIIEEDNINLKDSLIPLAGLISEGVARTFIGFCEIYKDLTTWEEILADPENAHVPSVSEGGANHAIAGTIAARVDASNFVQVLPYIQRMSEEFQLVLIRGAFQRNRAAIKKKILTPADSLARCKEFMGLARDLRLEIYN